MHIFTLEFLKSVLRLNLFSWTVKIKVFSMMIIVIMILWFVTFFDCMDWDNFWYGVQFQYHYKIYFIKSNKTKGYQMKCILDELQQGMELLEAKKWFDSRHKHLSDQLFYNENKMLWIYFNRNFWIESFIYVIIQ
jgi:hypothetical protein